VVNWVRSLEFSWQRQLFGCEVELLINLVEMLGGCRLLQEVNSWWWRPEGNVGFTIKSTYKILERLLVLEDNLGGIEKRVFDYLWENSAPSKTVDFS